VLPDASPRGCSTGFSQLVKTHDRLCIEHLAVANLVRNKHLSRAITDAGWSEFARQLRYKMECGGPPRHSRSSLLYGSGRR